jgi:ribonuclease H2 subunit A
MMGIDEAGRGPVLGTALLDCGRAALSPIALAGPMVYGVAYCPVAGAKRLEEFGFDGERRAQSAGGLRATHGHACADSKKLSEEDRERLFKNMSSAGDFMGWAVHVLSPIDLSRHMLSR